MTGYLFPSSKIAELIQIIREKRFVPYRLIAPYRYQAGAIYWCGYWQKYYTVIKGDDRQVKVRWEDEKETIHSTSLSPAFHSNLNQDNNCTFYRNFYILQ